MHSGPRHSALGFLGLAVWGLLVLAGAAPVGIPASDGGRRVEVLFLGSENLFGHDPVARFRVIRKALGPRGVDFTYTDTTASLTSENLARFDALLVFANHETIGEEEKKALLDFAGGGGGCVLLHCAAGCFRKSNFDAYVDLLGAQFKSHGTGVFRAEIVAPDHELMAGWDGFECWDETYVHKRHGSGRTVLQRRDGEPWTWVKTYGEGRVFYTASGHDNRCWGLPAFHELIYRAVLWTARGDAAEELGRLGLPRLEYRRAEVPKDPADPVGPNNELQLPLAPAESLKLAQIPPGFDLQLFASEPEVVNPICLSWDHRGRLWTVEAFDYPHKVASDEPQDRIKILEDTDGDGVADDVKVFAEGLNICTSVLPMPGGAIATDGADMVYLRDLDGDDRADEREVIFSGILLRDTHACTSNLKYGFDNWIYATVGYSGLDVTVAGQRYRSEMGVFRFKPDGSAFEVLQATTNNTWGIGFTEEGHVVGSTANGNPSWYLSVPDRFMTAAGLEPEKVPRADSNDTVYPITWDYFQNNPKEKVSSGAGHAVYTARRFPEEWWNRRVFICEPPLHLVAAPRISIQGTRFETTGFEDNLYASADAWSAPVAAEVGPDGAVWIADWYNPVCNHNPYRKHHERGKGNAFVTADRDRSHGRIFRVFPSGLRGTLAAPAPGLGSSHERAAALGHGNLFWRLAAQRLFVARPGGGDVDVLVRLAKEGSVPAGAHALRALHGRGSPAVADIALQHLRSPRRGLALAALSVLPPDDPTFLPAVVDVLIDKDAHPMVRKEAALFLAGLPPDVGIGATFADLLIDDSSVGDHLRTAVGTAAVRHPEGFVRHLVESGVSPDDERIVRFLDPAIRGDLSSGLLAFARGSNSEIGLWVVDKSTEKEEKSDGEEKTGAGVLTQSARRGKELYLACVACHQPDGRGLADTFPPLDGSGRVRGPDDVLIKIVLKGVQGPLDTGVGRFDGVMPGHETLLDDKALADVLSYVRSAWSNRAGDVGPERVSTVREAVKDRVRPWTAEELE